MRDLTIHDLEAELLPARELMCCPQGPPAGPPPPPPAGPSNNGNNDGNGILNIGNGNGNFSGNQVVL